MQLLYCNCSKLEVPGSQFSAFWTILLPFTSLSLSGVTMAEARLTHPTCQWPSMESNKSKAVSLLQRLTGLSAYHKQEYMRSLEHSDHEIRVCSEYRRAVYSPFGALHLLQLPDYVVINASDNFSLQFLVIPHRSLPPANYLPLKEVSPDLFNAKFHVSSGSRAVISISGFHMRIMPHILSRERER